MSIPVLTEMHQMKTKAGETWRENILSFTGFFIKDKPACREAVLNHTPILPMQQFVSVRGSIISEYPSIY
jgi:hypothetical protein